MIALRSIVFGAVTVGLTAAAHTAAGGAVPSSAALTILLVVTAAVGVPLFRRRFRSAALIPMVVAAQVALHPVFQGLADAGSAGHAGHDSPSAMLGAHVVAGVLAVLLVTALDPAVRCLGLRGARMPVRLNLIQIAPVGEPRLVPVGDDPVPTPRVMAGPAPRRGPPIGPVFAAV